MNTKLIIIALVLFVVLGGGVAVFVKTRGIRNNNPGNLRETRDEWNGLDSPRSDGEFFRFVNPVFGIRAMAITLKNYQRLHGLDTIRALINRYAPGVENDTESYISSVAGRTGIPADQPINVADLIEPLVRAVIIHENGVNPYSDFEINEGLRLA